mgnify:CR=1 FL=1
MRRLLIIGCGDVVRRVLPQLVRRWRVYALVREWDPALRALGVVQIVGDLDRGEATAGPWPRVRCTRIDDRPLTP